MGTNGLLTPEFQPPFAATYFAKASKVREAMKGRLMDTDKH
jgi:hypothetical protein